MGNQLSIVDTEQEINLETNKEDIMSSFVKNANQGLKLGAKNQQFTVSSWQKPKV